MCGAVPPVLDTGQGDASCPVFFPRGGVLESNGDTGKNYVCTTKTPLHSPTTRFFTTTVPGLNSTRATYSRTAALTQRSRSQAMARLLVTIADGYSIHAKE